MATHSSTLAWRIPWTEEPGGLPSTRSPGEQVTFQSSFRIAVHRFLGVLELREV